MCPRWCHSGAGVGDDRAQVLAAGVAVSKDVRHMSLRRNRLTHKGLVPILNSVSAAVCPTAHSSSARACGCRGSFVR